MAVGEPRARSRGRLRLSPGTAAGLRPREAPAAPGPRLPPGAGWAEEAEGSGPAGTGAPGCGGRRPQGRARGARCARAELPRSCRSRRSACEPGAAMETPRVPRATRDDVFTGGPAPPSASPRRGAPRPAPRPPPPRPFGAIQVTREREGAAPPRKSPPCVFVKRSPRAPGAHGPAGRGRPAEGLLARGFPAPPAPSGLP